MKKRIFSLALVLVVYLGLTSAVSAAEAAEPTGWTVTEVVPCKYDDAGSFFEGLAAVQLDGKWGFIDKTGNQAVPCKYDLAEYFSECLSRVYLNGKYGFIDSTG